MHTQFDKHSRAGTQDLMSDTILKSNRDSFIQVYWRGHKYSQKTGT